MLLPLTPSQTAGPFFSIGLLRAPMLAELVPAGTPGAIRVHGVVFDGAGEPVTDALVELWQADPAGRYPAGAAGAGAAGAGGFSGFGRSGTAAGGRFDFLTVKPGRVAGPAGTLQAPHLSVGIFARGLLRRLATRLYFPDEEAANAEDPLLGGLAPAARATLVAEPAGEGSIRLDIRLQGPGQTTFFAL